MTQILVWLIISGYTRPASAGLAPVLGRDLSRALPSVWLLTRPARDLRSLQK